MNTYDEGKDGEETSIHTREKVGSENKNKVFTEEEKADEIDNLNDIKNYKSIIISDNKNAESEKENKDEQITNIESVSASSPSPLPDPNNKDDKEMEELKKKYGMTKDYIIDAVKRVLN